MDAFRARHPGAAGATVWQPVTAPERRAFRRVDYVLVVPGRAFPGAVIDSRVVVDAPGRLPDGTSLWPSDHYGVLADLAVFPPPTTPLSGEAPGRGRGDCLAARHGARAPGPAPRGLRARHSRASLPGHRDGQPHRRRRPWPPAGRRADLAVRPLRGTRRRGSLPAVLDRRRGRRRSEPARPSATAALGDAPRDRRRPPWPDPRGRHRRPAPRPTAIRSSSYGLEHRCGPRG